MMSEYPSQNQQDTFQMIWTKRLFVLSLVLLGIVFALQGVGILEFPVTSTTSQQKQIKPVRVGGLLCQEPVWNFGSVDSIKNSRLSHEFILVNESKETVTIETIHSTCGCMVAEDFDKELTTGESTKIKINVQLPQTPQLFQKNLAVQTNIGVLPLDVIGEIAANSSLYCVPSKVNFGIIRSDENAERTVRILRYDLSPINIREIQSNRYLKVEVSSSSNNQEAYKVNLRVQLTTNEILPGNYDWSIKVITDHSNNSVYEIPVSAIVEETE